MFSFVPNTLGNYCDILTQNDLKGSFLWIKFMQKDKIAASVFVVIVPRQTNGKLSEIIIINGQCPVIIIILSRKLCLWGVNCFHVHPFVHSVFSIS